MASVKNSATADIMLTVRAFPHKRNTLQTIKHGRLEEVKWIKLSSGARKTDVLNSLMTKITTKTKSNT